MKTKTKGLIALIVVRRAVSDIKPVQKLYTS